MNNKGFTLVELLAVIALIAILSGVGVSASSRYIVKSRQKTYQNFEGNLKTAAYNYISDRTDLVVPGDPNGYTVDAEELHDMELLDNLIDPSSKTPCDYKNSYVTVTGSLDNPNSYNIDYKYKICLRCSNYTSAACNN